MYEFAVNDNAENFPKVAVDAYPTVVIVSTFVDWGDQSLVPNIGEDARTEDYVKVFSVANYNLWSVYFIISFRIPSTRGVDSSHMTWTRVTNMMTCNSTLTPMTRDLTWT